MNRERKKIFKGWEMMMRKKYRKILRQEEDEKKNISQENITEILQSFENLKCARGNLFSNDQL